MRRRRTVDVAARRKAGSQDVPRGLRPGRLASFRGGGRVRRERRPLGLHANGARDPSMRLLGSRHGASARSSASPTARDVRSRRAATRASPRVRRRRVTEPRPRLGRAGGDHHDPAPPCVPAASTPSTGTAAETGGPTARTAPPEPRARWSGGGTQAVPPREAAPTRARELDAGGAAGDGGGLGARSGRKERERIDVGLVRAEPDAEMDGRHRLLRLARLPCVGDRLSLRDARTATDAQRARGASTTPCSRPRS